MRPISAKSTVGTNSPFPGRSANFQKKIKIFHFFSILHPRTEILCPYITKGTDQQMHSVPQRMGYVSIIFSLLAVPDICQVRRRWSEHQRRGEPCQNVRLVNANLIIAKHPNLCTFKLAPYTKQDCQQCILLLKAIQIYPSVEGNKRSNVNETCISLTKNGSGPTVGNSFFKLFLPLEELQQQLKRVRKIQEALHRASSSSNTEA